MECAALNEVIGMAQQGTKLRLDQEREKRRVKGKVRDTDQD